MPRSEILLLSIVALSFAPMAESAPTFVYFGTQDTSSMGFALATFDAERGALSPPKFIAAARDPAFFVIHPNRKYLYVCNTGTPGGVSSYAVETASGALTYLNHQLSPGRGPSHLSLDRSGRYVLNANYGGGHIEIHAIDNDGSLGSQTAFIRHTGRSVHLQRQDKPYAHWFGVDPSNRFALAADLGADKIFIYRFDANSGSVEAHEPAHAAVPPGSGPRHLAWHPNGRHVYAIQELSNRVIAFAWDSDRGTLNELQSVATLPEEFQGTNTAGEIAVRHDGRFLYVSNRGHDSIAVFAVDPSTGRLRFRQRVGSQGKTPRYFAFDPSQRWLIVSNQDSDNIIVFRADPESGELSPQGDPIPLIKPMGVVFMP